jgi:DNA-binding transcriptional MerR regulator
MTHEQYHIGQLAAELNLNPKTIRYYEELGLLTPATRTAAGYRQYTSVERDTLRFIIKAKAAGLTLAEIGEILTLRRGGEEPCRHVRALLDRKLEAVEAQLRALTAFRDELRALRDVPAAEAACGGEVCGIIERHVPQRHEELVRAI